MKGSKVVLCVPVVDRPRPETLFSIEDSVELLDAEGIDHSMVSTVANPYISAARSKMLRQALDAGADQIVFIDHDISWRPVDLLALIRSERMVAAGTYRYKKPEVEYMGQLIPGNDGTPRAGHDGALLAHSAPAGFMKITRDGVNLFAKRWPELLYGEPVSPHVDLFNHGAHEGVWYGEDYAFCRRWIEKCGDLWIIPDMDIVHWGSDGVSYPGNYHIYLQRQPGGALSECEPA